MTEDINLEHLAKAIAAAYDKIEFSIIELAYLLKKARDQFPSDKLFGKWIKENDLDRINRWKRQYLIKLATMIEQGKATEEQILGMKLKDPREMVTRCEHAHAGFMLVRHAAKVRHTGGPRVRVPVSRESPQDEEYDEGPPLEEGEGEPPKPLNLPVEIIDLSIALADLRKLAESNTPESLWAKVPPLMNAEIREHMLFLIGWFDRFGQIIEDDPKAYEWK